jgi:MGT family glycosyltransferase
MSRALLFSLPLQGHTNPTLPLVQELVRRGEEITYYSLEPLRAAIEQTGATFRSYGSSYEPLPPPVNAFAGMSRVIAQRSPKMLADLLPAVRAFQPDYLLHDALALWGKLFGEILGVPTVCSTSTFVMGWRMWLSAPSLLPQLLRERWQARDAVARARVVAAQLHDTYDVKKPSIYDANVSLGDLTLVYTSKLFHPFASTFDNSVKFVGPSILPRPEAPAFPFEQLSGDPLIYISLGTLFTQHLAFFRTCLEALSQSPYQVVMAIGDRVSRADLGTMPANAIVREFVPQLDILQHAALFITHGGMNSASEGLYYGVPLLVVPQAQDQFYVGKRVAKLKAGHMLFMHEATVQRVREVVRELIGNPLYARNSAKVGASFHAAGGYQRAADEVTAFKRALVGAGGPSWQGAPAH